MAQAFKCSETKGIAMASPEGYKPEADGFKNVFPLVIIEAETMTIVWGDSEKAGGTQRIWKAHIINRNENAVSAVALDKGDKSSTPMLYSMDIKLGNLYMSAHKLNVFYGSAVQSFVSKCVPA
jgi:hypothetical protein